EWGDLVATWLNRAGTPKASQAGVPGQAPFSVESFLTNYNALSPTARQLMFNGTGQSSLRSSLDDLVKALGAMRGTDRAAVNTSKTAQQGIALGIAGGLMKAPISTLSAVGAANITARAFYNPTFIRLMTLGIKATRPDMRAQFIAQGARLAQSNPAIAQDVGNLMQSFALPAAAGSPGATTGNPEQQGQQ